MSDSDTLPYHQLPFLEGAKRIIQDYDVSVAELTADSEHPAVERAVHRVESAIKDGENGYNDYWNSTPSERIELLSYPLARILVSQLNDDVVTERFIVAEAESGAETLEYHRTTDHSDYDVSILDLFEEVGYEDSIWVKSENRPTPIYGFDVVPYLNLTGSINNPAWDIRRQGVSDGVVTLNENEVIEMFRFFARKRVGDGLPLDVPEPIQRNIDVEVAKLQTFVQDIDRGDPRNVGGVDDVDELPQFIQELIETANSSGETLTEYERTIVIRFLCSVGVSPEEVVDFLGLEGAIAEHVKMQADRVGGETGESFWRVPSYDVLDRLGLVEESPPGYDTPLAEFVDTQTA